MAKSSREPGGESNTGKDKWFLEFLLLIWSLAGLGYFYYTQFLQPLWMQFFG